MLFGLAEMTDYLGEREYEDVVKPHRGLFTGFRGLTPGRRVCFCTWRARLDSLSRSLLVMSQITYTTFYLFVMVSPHATHRGGSVDVISDYDQS